MNGEDFSIEEPRRRELRPRPKRLVSLEMAVRHLLKQKDRQKAVKEDVDNAAEEVSSLLKKANLTNYGWKENGRSILVSLEDKELVHVREQRPKGKKGDVL